MFSSRKLFFPRSVVLLLLGLPGCSDGPNIVKVTGTLTYKGKPVPNALLTFEPAHGRQSWAETDEQGRFNIHYHPRQDGAVVGTHKLFLEFRPTTDAQREAIMQGKQPQLPPDLRALFSKYSPLNSKHTVEISPSTKELQLDLD